MEDKKPGASDADEILRSIRRIVQQISIHSRKLLRETGLTTTQVLCLQAIGANTKDEYTAADLSRQVQLRPATITGIIDRLERDGLIRRDRRSRDRRKVCLLLTETGAGRVKTLPPPLQERFVQRLGAISEAERRRIRDALARLVDLMEATDLDVSPILIADEENRILE